MEQSTPISINKILKDLNPANPLDMRIRALEQLRTSGVSSFLIVRALTASKEHDSSYEVRKMASELLHAAVHQELLQKHPELAQAAASPVNQPHGGHLPSSKRQAVLVSEPEGQQQYSTLPKTQPNGEYANGRRVSATPSKTRWKWLAIGALIVFLCTCVALGGLVVLDSLDNRIPLLTDGPLQKPSSQAATNEQDLVLEPTAAVDSGEAEIPTEPTQTPSSEATDVEIEHRAKSTFVLDSGDVVALAISGNENLLSVASSTGFIAIWQLGTGELLRTWQLSSGPARDVTFLPDESTLVSLGTDGHLRFWQLDDGALLRTIPAAAGELVTFSQDGSVLVSSTGAGVDVWDVSTGSRIRSVGVDRSFVTRIALSPEKTRVAMSKWDHNIDTCLVSDTNEATYLGRHPNVSALDFSSDGTLLVSSSAGSTVHLWDVELGLVLRTWEGRYAHYRWIAFAPDDNLIAAISTNDLDIIRLSSTAKGLTPFYHTDSESPLCCVAFTPMGSHLAVAEGNTVYLWEIETVHEVTQAKNETYEPSDSNLYGSWPLFSQHYPIYWASDYENLKISADGSKILVSDPSNRIAEVWDIRKRRLLNAVPNHGSSGFAPDSEHFYVTMNEGTIAYWSVNQTDFLYTFGSGYSVGFSPDGEYFATLSDQDGKITVWSPNNGGQIQQWGRIEQPYSNPINLLFPTFTPDSHGIVWSVRGVPSSRALPGDRGSMIEFGNILSGEVESIEIDEDHLDEFVLAPDGSFSIDPQLDFHRKNHKMTMPILPANVGPIVPTLKDPNGSTITDPEWLKMSPDARFLASVNGGVARLWNVQDSSMVASLGVGQVSNLEFTADGTLLAWTGGQGSTTIQLWRVNNGELLHTFSFDAEILSLAFSKDSTTIVVLKQGNVVEVLPSIPDSSE